MASTTQPQVNKSVPASSAEQPTEVAAPGAESRQQAMIAEAAYFLAEKRGFEAGHELEDWLTAEAVVTQSSLQQEQAASELH